MTDSELNSRKIVAATYMSMEADRFITDKRAMMVVDRFSGKINLLTIIQNIGLVKDAILLLIEAIKSFINFVKIIKNEKDI